jgi:hypothetical protein
LSTYKVSEKKIKRLFWFSLAVGIFSTRTVVALIRPEPIIEESTAFLTLAWVISTLCFSWSLAAERWNRLISSAETSPGRGQSTKSLSAFKSSGKKSRNTAAVLFIIGVTMTSFGWKDPNAYSCTMDTNDLLHCSYNLSTSVIILIASVPFFIFWLFVMSRTSAFSLYVAPTLKNASEYLDEF